MPQRRDEIVARRVVEDGRADGVGDLEQDVATRVLLDLTPHEEPDVRRQPLEHVGEIGGVQRSDTRVQLGQVLPVLEMFEQIPLGPFLTVRQGLEHPMPLEEVRDLFERVLESHVGGGSRHGSVAP